MDSSPSPRTLRMRLRDRVAKQGLATTIGYLIGTALLEKTGVSIMRVYGAGPKLRESKPAAGVVLRSITDLTEQDRADLYVYGGERLLRSFENNFKRGYWCVAARVGQRLACVCWLTTVPNFAPTRSIQATVIQYCFTIPAFRGHSLYSSTLREAYACAETFGNERSVYIESSVFNQSSIRGIERAGFEPLGTCLYVAGRCVFRQGGTPRAA